MFTQVTHASSPLAGAQSPYTTATARQSIRAARSTTSVAPTMPRRAEVMGSPPRASSSTEISAPATSGPEHALSMQDLHALLGYDASIPEDVGDRLVQTLQVLVDHGVSSRSRLESIMSTALAHDVTLTVLNALGSNALGYTGGLSLNALVLSPLLTKVVSQRGLFNGAMTVTMNTGVGTLAGAMLVPALAAGPEGSLPKSIRDRPSRAARGLHEAAFTLVHDLVRQCIPVLQVLSYPSQGASVSIAGSGRQHVVADAGSRPVSAVLNAIRSINAGRFPIDGLYADEATYNERLLLQTPARLDQWLSDHADQGLIAALVPTRAGMARSFGALPSGLKQFCLRLPAVIPQALMGGLMISEGLMAASGRAAERAMGRQFPEGYEDQASALHRRLSFGCTHEAILEAALVGMGTIYDELISSQFATQAGDWVSNRGGLAARSFADWSVNQMRWAFGRRPMAAPALRRAASWVGDDIALGRVASPPSVHSRFSAESDFA
ncbi:hypothetical protein SAMN05216359_102487 [Roseateles sp. YR242]|uniref:hypothetical protein n=1 Tax=Roseateles sp. YR242 TaxID=1855305 RepID=UPI0008D377A0|nr:hypothetical protein [Roseateles sp. YR242]SEK63639.1 hypothetical protein SAMN05216359_102487 [Roseateles sp. YR242]